MYNVVVAKATISLYYQPSTIIMKDYRAGLEKKMYGLFLKVTDIIDIGKSLSEGRKPTEMETDAHVSAYDLAIEARGLFRLYNQWFPGDSKAQEFEGILDKTLDAFHKDFVDRLSR